MTASAQTSKSSLFFAPLEQGEVATIMKEISRHHSNTKRERFLTKHVLAGNVTIAYSYYGEDKDDGMPLFTTIVLRISDSPLTFLQIGTSKRNTYTTTRKITGKGGVKRVTRRRDEYNKTIGNKLALIRAVAADPMIL